MARIAQRSVVSGLWSTAAPPAWVSGVALTGLRLLVGLLWLWNVFWKIPPDFGENKKTGLYFWTHLGVEFPVFPPHTWLLEHVVLPNFTAFGWLTFVVESLLAVLLLTGTAVRLAALIGVGQSLAIGLTVAEAPNEWPWAYAMMAGIHLVLLLTASAQYAAVDAVRGAAAGDAGQITRRLLVGWGVVLGIIGIIAVIVSSDKSFRAADGDLVGNWDLEVGVGSYNMLAATVLLAVGVLISVGALLHNRILVLLGGFLALVSAVSIYVQWGRSQIWLGATPSTAAVFMCAAVVVAATTKQLTGPPRRSIDSEGDH